LAAIHQHYAITLSLLMAAAAMCAKFWLDMLNDLKNRGVQDILIARWASIKLYRSLGNQGLDNSFGVKGVVTPTLPAGLLFFCCGDTMARPGGKIFIARPVITENPFRLPFTFNARYNSDCCCRRVCYSSQY
jgi:hypothetical protein